MKLLDELQAPQQRERAPMLARLGLTDKAIDPRDVVFEGGRFGGQKMAPEETDDLTRIVNLPRRPRPTDEQQALMAEVMTSFLRRDNADCQCAKLSPEPCIKKFLPIQGWYLYEARQVGGALGHIIVGGGKTGIDIMLAMVIPGVRRAVLMLPPELRKQFQLDYQRWAQHFRVPNLGGSSGAFYPDRPTLDLLAYSELSRPEFAMWLKTRNPDLFIGDEVQALKDKTSVRTDRFLRYHIDTDSEHEAKCCMHSGTLTSSSLDDYGHLSALCLRERSPLPLETGVLRTWCAVLNPPSKGGGTAPIGALRKLCETGETARAGFRRRLVETPGVITTEDAALPTKLVMIERDPGPLPPMVAAALAQVRMREQRPDGEELIEKTEIAACCRQLAAGFFYRWKYPRGEPEALILEWFGKRQAWNRELRERLEHRSDQLDSPALLQEAADRALSGYRGDLPVWRSHFWADWKEIADQVQPEQDTVWIDEFLARDSVVWAKEAPGIVWTQHTAFARKVSELGGLPYYGPSNDAPLRLNPTPLMLERRQSLITAGLWEGDTAENWIKIEDGSRSIVAQIRAHGTGKNLQHAFWRNLVANAPIQGWEQLIGRTHRPHQKAPIVEVHYYAHTPEVERALEDARELAKYVHQTTGKMEKLIFAEYRKEA